MRAQQMGELVRLRVHFAKSDLVTCFSDNDSGLVGAALRMSNWMHGGRLSSGEAAHLCAASVSLKHSLLSELP